MCKKIRGVAMAPRDHPLLQGNYNICIDNVMLKVLVELIPTSQIK
jgi:hypothetical protein